MGLFLSPLLLATLGWRGLFFVFGALGLPLLAAWLAIVPKPPPLIGVKKAEAAPVDPVVKTPVSPVPGEVPSLPVPACCLLLTGLLYRASLRAYGPAPVYKLLRLRPYPVWGCLLLASVCICSSAALVLTHNTLLAFYNEGQDGFAVFGHYNGSLSSLRLMLTQGSCFPLLCSGEQ